MGMSGAYGEADRAESIATVHAALDAGITLLDTGDFYAHGPQRTAARRSAAPMWPRDAYQLSVKFGAQRRPGGRLGRFDARPSRAEDGPGVLAAAPRHRLHRRLPTARLDPVVPIEETIGAIGELVDAGYVRHIGLSEVGSETIRRAAAVRPISDLQIEYSLMSRGIERDSSHLPRTGDRRDRLRCALAWTDRRALDEASSGQVIPGSRVHASPRPTWTATWPWSRRCAASPTNSGSRWRRRHRVGGLPRRRRRAAGRCAHPRPADRSPRRGRVTLTATAAGSRRQCPQRAVAGDRYGAAQMAALDSER